MECILTIWHCILRVHGVHSVRNVRKFKRWGEKVRKLSGKNGIFLQSIRKSREFFFPSLQILRIRKKTSDGSSKQEKCQEIQGQNLSGYDVLLFSDFASWDSHQPRPFFSLAGEACRRRSAFHRQNHAKRPLNFLKEDKICYKMGLFVFFSYRHFLFVTTN